MDIQLLKESMNTPHHQYDAFLYTNIVTFRQHLSEKKKYIKHLQQMKLSNAYPTTPRPQTVW